MATRARTDSFRTASSRRRMSPLATAAIAVAGILAARQATRFAQAQYAMARTSPDMKRVLDKLVELGACQSASNRDPLSARKRDPVGVAWDD